MFFPFFISAQLFNGGMENYVFTTTDTLPDGWTVDSGWSTVIGKSSNAYSGNYSFAINTWYSYAPGILMNGMLPSSSSIFFDWIKAGMPTSGKSAQLKGFYMYTDTVWGDSAVVKVALKKWNQSLSKPDTVAFGIKKLPFASAWTQFTVDLTDLMPGINPDSVVVYFMTYDYLAGTQPICAGNECRYLYIDELSLEGTLGVKEEVSAPMFSCVYAEKTLKVKNNIGKESVLQIFAADGKLVVSRNIAVGETELNMQQLETGLYFVSFAGHPGNAFRFVR